MPGEVAMLAQFLIIMGFQLAGEALVSGCGLAFPGPLCGLLLLLAWLCWTGGPSAQLSRAADILVDHLGLLFVPAGAAIVGYGTLLFVDGIAIVGALLLSTGLAIFVTGLLGAADVSQPASPFPE
jgi:holin-like protein